MKTYEFNPRNEYGERLKMVISSEDVKNLGGRKPWYAIITDISTGRKYDVKGVPCGMPGCWCDVEIVREVEKVVSSYINHYPDRSRPYEVVINGKIYDEIETEYSANGTLERLRKEGWVRFIKDIYM